jgi:hypothetical protein
MQFQVYTGLSIFQALKKGDYYSVQSAGKKHPALR